MCPSCGADKQDYVVASGRGTRLQLRRAPCTAVPGKTLPFVVALVELEEGVRMIAELVDVDPATVTIGMPVPLALTKIDDALTLPYWTAAVIGTELPTMTIEATPTFIVSSRTGDA